MPPSPKQPPGEPSLGSPADEPVERFRPTSGRLLGAVAVVVAVGVVALTVAEGGRETPVAVVAGAVLGGLLAWAAMLRPALWTTREHLVMRNMFETVHVPLAAIEELAVRQVLAVRAGDRRFVSTVVGRPLRKVIRSTGRAQAAQDSMRGVLEQPYPDYVETRIRQQADEARAQAGVRRGSEEQVALAGGVRRQPAWLPIGLLAATTLVLVLALVW